MIVLPFIGFVLVALIAVAFGTFPIWRRAGKGRVLLGLAVTLFLLGVGGGVYWMVGAPGLALRASEGLQARDVRVLVPYLIARVRQSPADEQSWIYLGRAYMTLGDADDAAKAYGRAVTLTRLAHQPDSALESIYGQTLVDANGGITPDAEAAFNEALRLNPQDMAAQLYLGLARAMRGDKQGALALWQSLLAELPVNSPLHQTLVDRIAMLTAQTIAPNGANAPDPRQMVASLAARLKDNPDDAAGWQRLIRAYTVLGETDKAKEALATARKSFASQRNVLAELDVEAKDLKLE